MDLGIEGKVAMITGGSRGLGRQAAYSLAREGCKVSICARSQDQLDATVSEMAAAGYQVHGTQGDVTVEADATRFHQDTVGHLGQPDILVNNVGGRRGSVIFEETSLEQFREGLEVNLVSAYRMIALVLPHMREQGWGRIINISSIYGREHGGSIDYMAGESGVDSLVQAPGAAIGAHQRAGQLHSAGVDRLPGQHLGPVPAEQPARGGG